MAEIRVTAVNIPCPHCTAIRVCRETDERWIGDAVCEECGAFVPGQDWRDSGIRAMTEACLRADIRTVRLRQEQLRTLEERQALLKRLREKYNKPEAKS